MGVGSGLSYAGLGPTHHSCEDIALLRALPGLAVVCPCDAFETRAALRAALRADHPTYLRLGKKGEPKVHADTPADFAIGKALTVREGRDVCLLATGTILPEALHAADALAAAGVSAQVVSFHTVKPLDTDRLRDAFAAFRLVATIEEHSVVGGFGSAVAEWLVDNAIIAARLSALRHARRLLQARRRAGIRARETRTYRGADRFPHQGKALRLMKTEAAILVELNKPLEVVSLGIPALRAGQVLVEIAYSGVCGTQVNEWLGKKGEDKWLPHCMGHEATGRVAGDRSGRDQGEG